MCKQDCNKCYWKFHSEGGFRGKQCAYHVDLIDDCDDYKPQCEKCESDECDYKYKGELLCTRCLMEKLDISEESSGVCYFCDGEFLGTDEDDFIDVLQNVDSEIEEV